MSLTPTEIRVDVEEFIRVVDDIDVVDAAQLLLPLVGELLAHDGYEAIQTNHLPAPGWDVRGERTSESSRETIAVEYKHGQRQLDGRSIYEVIRKLSEHPLDRFVLISRSGFSARAVEEVAGDTPVAIELLGLEDVRQWALRMEAPPPPPPARIQALVSQFSEELAKAVADDPRVLDSIEWRDMERVLETVLSGLGFEAELTPSSKDGGKDIVLRITDMSGELRSFIVEVKHWRSGKHVGGTVLTDFVRVVAHEEHEAGLILATYGFASNATAALTEIERRRVRLGHESKIVSLCRTYVRSQVGLWAPLDGDGLAELLFEETN
jgi:hypothetical protein